VRGVPAGISRGNNCYVYGAEIRCTRCPAPTRLAAPTPAPAPAVAPVAVAGPEYRGFGALQVDARSFRAWEREYEEEGR
jgi:hypothetical protein